MAYWDDLRKRNSYSPYRKETRYSEATAAQYPEYEQSTPQYVAPSPYALAQQGYRSNTLIYACIQRRMRAVSAAPLWAYDGSGPQKKVIQDLAEMGVLKNPNDRMTEKTFWQVTQMYLDISGFSCWEIERNNVGDPIRLWPMRSDWCSFLRGNGRPLRAVRYQPYGLPPQDIPIEDLLLFQYFDPLFPMLKGYSPTMAALQEIYVDNGMTQFLYNFIKEGARFSGLLSTEQDLDDIEAERIKARWKSQHGGTDNWNNIAVLGRGASYQNTSMNFNDMAFPELDGRTEARICMVFEISPILLGAKVGLSSSTYSNYVQARKAWYEEWVTPQWEFLAESFSSQMFRTYGSNGTYEIAPNRDCAFMTKRVAALQENRDLSFRRAVAAARANLLTRDQALEEIGMDPIDNKPVYIGAALRVDPISASQTFANIQGMDDEELAEMQEDNANPQDLPPSDVPGPTTADRVQFPNDVDQQSHTNDVLPAMALEEKRFRSYAKKRIRENKLEELPLFDFVITPAERQLELIEQYTK